MELTQPKIKIAHQEQGDASAVRAYANTRVEHWQGRFDHAGQVRVERKTMGPGKEAGSWVITHAYTLDWPRGSRVTRVEESTTETTTIEAVPDDADPNTTHGHRTTMTRLRVYAEHPTYGQVSFVQIEEVIITQGTLTGVVTVNVRGTGWV